MIIHATRKLAQRLPEVSTGPPEKDNALGSWHADRLTLDRRQCVLFCHDETRAALFVAGLRKPEFAELGNMVFRSVFSDTLRALDCPDSQIRRALMTLGPYSYDTSTDRSVLSSMRVVLQDLEAYLWNFPNVLQADPVEVSVRLTRQSSSSASTLLVPGAAFTSSCHHSFLRGGRSSIVFYYRKDMDAIASGLDDHKTDTGRMKVSCLELTMFDLLRYRHAGGGLNHIATVISDLGDRIDAPRLAALSSAFERSVVQRLGHLLGRLDHQDKANLLYDLVLQGPALPWIEPMK